ncbi:hypothetical protein LCGC14_0620560 [marine sediment metagenome]|uniref:DUF2399 domain-containing protein n=1 Tax=marine sediment metagenome TaxID=412755 RepID=A0A0F9UDF1_9ZZZZ
MDYSRIKEAAKLYGGSVTDWLALAPANDPFYVGTPKDIINAQWFRKLWDTAGYVSGIHLRRAHYWAVSQSNLLLPNGERYENTDKCWKFLTQASKMSRYLGLVCIEDVVDRKNPEARANTYYAYGEDAEVTLTIPELQSPAINIWNLTNGDAQPYHLEIWCEKSTMNDILQPLCATYGANLVTFNGEVSITSVYDLIKRGEAADGKPIRILYISDFDPAGISMPVAMSRKIEFMLQKYEHQNWDVKVQSIMLTAEQVRKYQLPRTPIKKSEKRAGKFEEAFGTGAVELDALEALHPGELEALVTLHLHKYYSVEAMYAVQTTTRNIKAEVQIEIDKITAKYATEIAAMQNYLDDLEALKFDIVKRKVYRSDYPAVAEDEEDFLFSSDRSYPTQIAAYKSFKNGDN